MNKRIIYTIGHSNHDWDTFAALLKLYNVEVVADVRSKPYSKYCPHFGKKRIEQALTEEGMQYVFLGNMIGGMPEDDVYYDDKGYVLYDVLASSPRFLEGVSQIGKLIERFVTALMCGEEDPSRCHRRLLIGPVLMSRGSEIRHIRKDGAVDIDTPSHVPQAFDQAGRGRQLGLFDDSMLDRWKSPGPVRKRTRD